MRFISSKLIKIVLVIALTVPALLVLPSASRAYSLLTTISSTNVAVPGGTASSLLRPIGVAVNPTNGHVFVANNDCQTFCTLSVFTDAGTGTSFSSSYVLSLAAGNIDPRDVAFNTATNHLWVADVGTHSVIVLSDAASGMDSVAQFSLGDFVPNGIAINSATGHVFVTSSDTAGHSIISVYADSATPSVFGDPFVRDNEGLQGIAVNPTTGHVFVTDFQNGNVDVLADSSGDVSYYGTVPSVGTNPVAVAVNPATGHAFVVNSGSNDVTPLQDDSTGVAPGTHLDVGTNPVAIAFNPNTGHFYVANGGNLAGGGASLMVINDNQGFPISVLDPTIPFSSAPSRVAVNTATNRIFVTLGTANQLAVLGDLIPTSVTGTTNTAAATDTTVTLTANAWIGPSTDNVPVPAGSVRFTVMASDGTTPLGTEVFGIVNHNGTVSAVYTIPAGTDPGTYTVKLRYFSSDNTYAISDGSGTLELSDDGTPPAASPSLSGTQGANGWYIGTVTVTWNWADNDGGSGIDSANCPATSTYSGPDGSAITVDGTCKDLAGNAGQSTSPSFNYDASAPTAAPTVSGTEGDNGWYTTPVTIDWNWSDPAGGSGLDSANCPASSSTGSIQGEQPFQVTCLDLAGNSGSASLTVKVDTARPTINATLTPANPASTGWYNQSTGAPTVSFTCSDATSGLAEACPADYTFPEGANQDHSVTVSDNAGLSNGAGAGGINVDLTAPTVSFSGNAGTYTVDQQVDISCDATDGGSGIATTSCADITGPASSFGVGSHTYSATASDVAGNSATASTSFSVTVTPAGICALETQFIEGSSAFQRQSPARQASSLRGAQSSCLSAVNSISRGGGPLQRRALATYQANLFMYVAQGWLTPAQMQTLVSLVNEM